MQVPSNLRCSLKSALKAATPITRATRFAFDDIFFRVGGAGVGRAQVDLRINANDTIIDHTWIWRADHGSGVGWNLNTSVNGLVVNGNRVTAYGLFVEHHQQYQVLWNGNAGRTYFYQSEIPYDPPDQASYSSGLAANGQRANDRERMGFLQSRRRRREPRSLGPRRLLCFPPSQCRAHARHRSAHHAERAFSSHDYHRARQSGRNLSRHRRCRRRSNRASACRAETC